MPKRSFFLVCDHASMITDAVFYVDGGSLLGLAMDYKENLQRRTAMSKQKLKAYFETKGEAKITVFDLIGRCPNFDRIGGYFSLRLVNDRRYIYVIYLY